MEKIVKSTKIEFIFLHSKLYNHINTVYQDKRTKMSSRWIAIIIVIAVIVFFCCIGA